MLKTVPYTPNCKNQWDDFVMTAKNGSFLFCRNYMDYHADRFPDSSLMFYDERGDLTALLPATVRDGALSSHAGLTFGGVISGYDMKVELMLDVFKALCSVLRAQGIEKLVYKAIPHIYHRLPAEEDLYALFRCGAQLVRRDVSSTIDRREKLPFSKGRLSAFNQAKKHELEVRQSSDFETFMAIEEELLRTKYDTRPTHSGAELRLLAERFPDHIKLFGAYLGSTLLAGVAIYESARVAHAQYIGANDEGRRLGALDLILSYLISDHYAHKDYFDFGISTEQEGRHLNEGLIANKQSYGARAVMYDHYNLDLAARQNT